MPRPLFDTPYIFGIHEPGGEQHMLEAGKPGWIVFTEGVGSDPGIPAARTSPQWSNQGLGVLCRINNGYYPGGTIPHSSRYEDFAQRCANYAAASHGLQDLDHRQRDEPPRRTSRRGHRLGAQRTAARILSRPVGRCRGVWRAGGSTRSSRMAILNQGETITPQLYARCYSSAATQSTAGQATKTIRC